MSILRNAYVYITITENKTIFIYRKNQNPSSFMDGFFYQFYCLV